MSGNGWSASDGYLSTKIFFFLRERTKMFPYDSGFHEVKKKNSNKKESKLN